MRTYAYKGEGVEKSALRYVRTKWMAPTNVVEYFLCISPAKYAKALPPARKMLFSAIMITITLSYAIIRIYTILHIYLQVPETEGLTELP